MLLSSPGRAARIAGAMALVAASVLAFATPAHADPIRDRQYWLADYGIQQAWNTTRGAGVTIAIIDTGIDGSHPDLAGAVVGGADFSGIGSPNGQRPVGSDGPSHGTMVASLAAARGRGSSGAIGVAPEANLLALSIGFGGVGTSNSDDQIAEAVHWAVDNGADIINMSLTRNTIEWPESWDDAFLYAMENDVVVVAAAGNRGSGTSQVGAPATMPGVLTVGGVDRNGSASWDASSQGITIGVSAPSEQLVGAVPGGGHVLWDGTSGATPIVAGVVALVRSAYPQLSAGEVINRITATASEAGAPGVDPIYGYGLLDAAAAVSATVPASGADPSADLADWIRVYRRADAEPVPVATAVPVPDITPEPLVQSSNPTGTLLPSVAQLRDVGVPLLVFVVFGGAFVTLAVRGIRNLRSTREQE